MTKSNEPIRKDNNEYWLGTPRWLDALYVIGFYVFHCFAKRRDDINRLHLKVINVITEVENVHKQAIEFWTKSSKTNEEKGCEVQLMIYSIDKLEGALSEMSGICDVNFDDDFNAFKESILDGEGESMNRISLEPKHPRFARMNLLANILKRKLRDTSK